MSPESSPDQIYLGAYGLCLDPGGRLLMTRLLAGPDAGRWTLPGGGVLWGEHPDLAVIRELEEETGLVGLNLVSVAAIYSYTYHRTPEHPLPPLHHVGIIYHIEPNSYQLHAEQGGTTDLCKWLTVSEARSVPQTPLGDFGTNLVWPSSQG